MPASEQFEAAKWLSNPSFLEVSSLLLSTNNTPFSTNNTPFFVPRSGSLAGPLPKYRVLYAVWSHGNSTANAFSQWIDCHIRGKVAGKRYRRFLYLLRRCRSSQFSKDLSMHQSKQLVPLVDIALMWRAHAMYPSLYSQDYCALRIPSHQDDKNRQHEGKGNEECGNRSFPLSMRQSEIAVSAREELLDELSTPIREELVSRWHEKGGRSMEPRDHEFVGDEDVPFLDACCKWIWGDTRASESLEYSKQVYGATFGEPYCIAGESGGAAGPATCMRAH